MKTGTPGGRETPGGTSAWVAIGLVKTPSANCWAMA
jgi:hypothetical protein